jgi:hypothetical protein
MDPSFEDYLHFQEAPAEESSGSVLVDDDDDDDDTVDQSHTSSALTEDDLFPDESTSDYPILENSQDDDTNLQSEASRLSPTPKHSSSFRGPLSPFSPLTRCAHSQGHNSTISWQSDKEGQEEEDLSLMPCRKVSVVVRIQIPEEKTRLCLFPLQLLPGIKTPSRSSELPSSSSSPPTTGAAIIQKAACDTNNNNNMNDLVVVNPCAFGTFIPAQLTMDTARLVASVANIESEDWARQYRFDQVFWDNHYNNESANNNNNNNNETSSSSSSDSLTQLAKSMGNDAVCRGESSVCLGVGGSDSGRTETIFGKPKTSSSSSAEQDSHYGLLGLTVASVLGQLSEHAVCTLSLLEIVEEEVLRDLLLHDPVESQSKLKIRNVDAKGAIVQNLSDVPLDSMTGLVVS